MTHNATLLLRIIAIIIAVAVVGGYAYNRTKSFARGPVIEVTYPTDGAVLKDTVIEIQGIAYNISYISLNGKRIFTEEDGTFEETLLLYEGYNIITLYAQDGFKRTTESTTHVTIIRPDTPPAPPEQELEEVDDEKEVGETEQEESIE